MGTLTLVMNQRRQNKANPGLKPSNRLEDFMTIKTLGAGAFGCVDLCETPRTKPYFTDNKLVAVKRFQNIVDREMAVKETNILARLDHERIVQYFEHHYDAKSQFC